MMRAEKDIYMSVHSRHTPRVFKKVAVLFIQVSFSSREQDLYLEQNREPESCVFCKLVAGGSPQRYFRSAFDSQVKFCY